MMATTKPPKMTDYNHSHHQQIIRCPNCRALITVEELLKYVASKPESKREAIEHEIAMWGLTHYDMAHYVENIVFCPACARISHLGDWLEVSGRSRNGSKK
jgi:4-hydroxy-3-methylbut-2-en-1-yl diphosphate synthase IspG/GcpE